MINELNTMIELQKTWDKVLHFRNEIEKAEQKIISIKEETSSRQKNLDKLISDNKSAKILNKDHDLRLAELDAKIKKARDRKDSSSSQKEIKALETEISSASEERDKLEEVIINEIDTLTASDKNINDLKEKNNDFIAEASQTEKVFAERIERFRALLLETENSFKNESLSLTSQFKSKFLKLIESSNGKAIIGSSGSKCGGCNNNFPPDLRHKLESKNSIISCPNCGKFIYLE